MQVQFQAKVVEMKGINEAHELRPSSIYDFRKDFSRGRREISPKSQLYFEGFP